jgi:hypothetical protein
MSLIKTGAYDGMATANAGSALEFEWGRPW